MRQFTIGNVRHRLVAEIDIEDNGPASPSRSARNSSTRWSPAARDGDRARTLHRPGPDQPARRPGGVRAAAPASPCSGCCSRWRCEMARRHKVWVIDDDRSIRWVLEKALEKAGMEVTCFDQRRRGVARLTRAARRRHLRRPHAGHGRLLPAGTHPPRPPDLPVIIMTAHSDLDSAVAAYQGGAFEYLPKPFDVDEAVELVRAPAATAASNRAAARPPEPTPEIIGEAPAMQEVFRAIGRLSRSNITVLINGESGTGKELVAHALHRHSPRARRSPSSPSTWPPSPDLMESELFGHERAPSPAPEPPRPLRAGRRRHPVPRRDRRHAGELQTRLLRVLADGEFYRVGGHEPRQGRCAHHRRHPPEPGATGAARASSARTCSTA
jgi:CheY-like chemotaxis protein